MTVRRIFLGIHGWEYSRGSAFEMTTKTAKAILTAVILFLCLNFSLDARAQGTGNALSGVVKDGTGAALSGAKVSLKNVTTGAITDTQSDSAGHYSFPSLAAGNYELDVSAPGFTTNTTQITMALADQIADVTMGGTLSLSELGFAPGQTQGSAADQARLDKRSHMLKVHQELGLIALAPIVANVITGAGAGGRATSSTDRYVHLGLGAASGDLYFTSAYFAIRAPKIPGTETRGPIRLHKILAWVHGPGMILTPILGAMAFNQKSRGEKVHGIASAHGAVAIITASAYGAAVLSVTITPDNWKIWKRF